MNKRNSAVEPQTLIDGNVAMEREEDDEYVLIFRRWRRGNDGNKIYTKHGKVSPVRIKKNKDDVPKE